jgi:hypothetical protein
MRNQDRLKQNIPETAAQVNHQYTPPTDIVKLPSAGKFYSKEHPLHNVEEVEIGFMTTKEEDILVSTAYAKQGKIIDKLVESLLIKSVKADTLLPGDKSAILINARKNAYGSEYKIQISCAICDHPNKHTVDLGAVGIKENNQEGVQFTDRGTFVVKLPKTQANVELKFLTSEDEEEIETRAKQKAQHNLPETLASDRLRQLIVSVNGAENILVINDFVSKLPITDSLFLKRKYSQIVPDIDFIYEVVCTNCEYENKGVVPVLADFFWPDE